MTPARILVIDDSLPDITLLRFGLDHHGEPYDLEILSDGASALRFVQESRAGIRVPEPCVILLDLHLPGHDGMAVLHAIRLAPVLSHIRVIILTGGRTSHRSQLEIENLGALLREKPMVLSDFIVLGREILNLCKGALSVAG